MVSTHQGHSTWEPAHISTPIHNRWRAALGCCWWISSSTPRWPSMWAEWPSTLGMGEAFRCRCRHWQVEFDMSKAKHQRDTGWAQTAFSIYLPSKPSSATPSCLCMLEGSWAPKEETTCPMPSWNTLRCSRAMDVSLVCLFHRQVLNIFK